MNRSLRELRLKKGLTQTQLATMLDISYQHLRNYEGGAYKSMKEELRLKISEVLGEDYHYNR